MYMNICMLSKSLILHIYYRGRNDQWGEMTSGAKRLVGRNDQGGNVLGAKRLGEEMVWVRNDPDSLELPHLGGSNVYTHNLCF